MRVPQFLLAVRECTVLPKPAASFLEQVALDSLVVTVGVRHVVALLRVHFTHIRVRQRASLTSQLLLSVSEVTPGASLAA